MATPSVSATTTILAQPSSYVAQDRPVAAATRLGLSPDPSPVSDWWGQSSGVVTLSASAVSVGSLGRFQRGQKVPLAVACPAAPDAAPVATITLNNAPVATIALPMAGDTLHFGLSYRIGSAFVLGTYRVAYAYAIGGVPSAAIDEFDVVAGGDSMGEVISMFWYGRPEASYVVAQLGGGRLVQGRNPHL